MFKEQEPNIIIDQEEIKENENLKKVFELREALWRKIGAVAFNDVMFEFKDLLKEKGVSEEEAQKYYFYHIFKGSRVGDAKPPLLDFEGDLSIKRFLEDQLTKVEEQESKEN